LAEIRVYRWGPFLSGGLTGRAACFVKRSANGAAERLTGDPACAVEPLITAGKSLGEGLGCKDWSMSRPARYEFVGGPLDTELLEVPLGLGGGPAGEVYVELTAARSALGDPAISPAGFTGPWVVYRLRVNPASGLRYTYVLADGDERDREKDVMQANLSRFLHRCD
jgi:hypothetical protein